MESLRALHIAQSGLADASLRLAVSGHHVANMNTAGFQPFRVHSSEQAGGGVSSQISRQEEPLAVSFMDRTQFDLASRIDLIDETMARLSAAASFRANLAALRAADETLGVVFDLRA